MIQNNQSGSELTGAGLGSKARLGINPFKSVNLRVGLRALGPGLLMAGAAVGTSHLVQSTRAGADFGFQLVVLVLMINALKYPFFEYGHRYAAATGENLLDGYLRMGRGFVYAFFLLAIFSAVGSTAAVTFVTVGLVQHFMGQIVPAAVWGAIVMALCIGLLVGNHYRRLDIAMKPLMAVLAVATVVAFVTAVSNGPVASPEFVSPSPWTGASLIFLIALMGWMPAPIEVSVWQSLWIQAKDGAQGRRTTVGEARFDFNFGYILSATLAVLFLGLGALVLHGSGFELQNASGAFVTQLVELYQRVLGGWAGPLIAAAAFATMFSTTLTVIDGYSRSLEVSSKMVFAPLEGFPRLYTLWMVLVCLGAFVLILLFVDSLTDLIDLVTVAAFLAAPVYGYLNYRLITSTHTPEALQPGRGMRMLSWAGLAFFVLVGFSFLLSRVTAAVG